jgi:hypothetical protein
MLKTEKLKEHISAGQQVSVSAFRLFSHSAF